MSWVTNGSWWHLPSLQVSQNERSEIEQGTLILLSSIFNTLYVGCPNRASHSWHALFFWAIQALEDCPWQNGNCLLKLFTKKLVQLFKELKLVTKDWGWGDWNWDLRGWFLMLTAELEARSSWYKPSLRRP